MKKFLPGMFLFGIVFSFTVAIQIGTTTLSASTKDKVKTTSNINNSFESIFKKLEVQTIEGKKFNLEKLKSPVVVINFWASWCIPCMEEMPSLVEFKKKFKKEDVTVVSLNTDESDQIKNIQKTIKKFNITDFEVVADKDTKIADMFKFSAIPVTIIFNRGKVVQYTNGPVDFNANELIEKTKEWIKK